MAQLRMSVEHCRWVLVNSLSNGTADSSGNDEASDAYCSLSPDRKDLVDALVSELIRIAEEPDASCDLISMAQGGELRRDEEYSIAAKPPLLLAKRQFAVGDTAFELFVFLAGCLASGLFARLGDCDPGSLGDCAGEIMEVAALVGTFVRVLLNRPEFEGYEHCIYIKALKNTGLDDSFCRDDVVRWMPDSKKCDIPKRRRWSCPVRDGAKHSCGFKESGVDSLDDTLAYMVRKGFISLIGDNRFALDR